MSRFKQYMTIIQENEDGEHYKDFKIEEVSVKSENSENKFYFDMSDYSEYTDDPNSFYTRKVIDTLTDFHDDNKANEIKNKIQSKDSEIMKIIKNNKVVKITFTIPK